MRLPDSIDNDAHRQRLRDDRVGQFHSPTSGSERLRIAFAKHAEEVTRYFVAQIVRISAQSELDVSGCFRIGHTMNEWVIRLELFLRVLDLFSNRRQHRRRLTTNALL